MEWPTKTDHGALEFLRIPVISISDSGDSDRSSLAVYFYS